MTVEEYLRASPGDGLPIGWTRNPLVLFVLAPLFVFVVKQRFASPKADERRRRSVWRLNWVLLGTAALLSWIFGIAPIC
jgi:omega-6 fatty acid desaturase (delta-12 desaturase)